MAKNTTEWVCSKCGHTVQRWTAKCRNCNGEASFEERTIEEVATSLASAGSKNAGAIAPKQAARSFSELKDLKISRTPSGVGELDRVLGGGFVEGEVVLLGGEPGCGKSTLCIQLSEIFGKMGHNVLYSSGEESELQIKLRADRLGINSENIKITYETNLETILGHIDEVQPKFMIIDSVQKVASANIASQIGSISQSNEAAHVLTKVAKSRGITTILINQIVKSGEFAGSEAIQHIVDATLMFEADKDSPLKYLRAIKNRFGPATEVGIFQHGETGLEEVADPSGILLEDGDPLPGEAAGFVSEGIRQIPVEIQALVTESNLPNPRKQFSSVDYQRAQIVCAILDKFAKTRLFESDVFVSTVAGIKVKDPLADLAVAAAIFTSDKEKKTEERTAYIGELSLTGKVRGTSITQRIKEAERLGFDRVVIPKSAKAHLKTKFKIKIDFIEYVKDLKNFV